MAEVRQRLERLYEEQRVKLWRSLLAYSADPEVASDSVAEAFAQAYARGAGLRDPAAWVWRTAFRVAAAELSRRRKENAQAPEQSAHLPDSLQDVLAALRSISPNQRLAVVLHDYADRPVAEVAATMGITRATVHVHLSQGRRRLRNLLETSGE